MLSSCIFLMKLAIFLDREMKVDNAAESAFNSFAITCMMEASIYLLCFYYEKEANSSSTCQVLKRKKK